MRGARRSGWGARPTAALLTLAAHALFLLLLVIERRNAPRAKAPAPQLVLIPITLLPITPRATARETREAEGNAPATRPRPVLPPATAITLSPSPSDPLPEAQGSVDWNAVAATSAARFAEEAERAAATFSPPPRTLREPCKPREQSFKFKEDQPPGKGGIAMITPGWEEPEADKHFFDDMLAGKSVKSSVPDAHTCE